MKEEDAEFAMFLVGCLCISVAVQGPGLVIGAVLIWLSFKANKERHEKKEEKKDETDET